MIEGHAEQRADDQERAVAPALASERQRSHPEEQAARQGHMALAPDSP